MKNKRLYIYTSVNYVTRSRDVFFSQFLNTAAPSRDNIIRMNTDGSLKMNASNVHSQHQVCTVTGMQPNISFWALHELRFFHWSSKATTLLDIPPSSNRPGR